MGMLRRVLDKLGFAGLIGIVLAALLLVALRVNLLGLSYRYGDALKECKALRQRKWQLTLQRSQLRDPLDLVRRARELGFRPPDRVIELPSPAREAGQERP
jgi:hypothetical protein